MTNILTEKRSSAITLSDMEIFIFPELLYSIVLANIMSPRIWEWRRDPWFKGYEKKSARRRIERLKQYIMEKYVFNLDLDTWGLTTKKRELDRFTRLVPEKMIKESNALFGYEGDKYYFDIDIRSHFGLDKYNNDIIPYWKTESLEAMDAFSQKNGYDTGAGECVTLAALYAAALFVVARIPLENIYLMATPLHSQNFIDTGRGLLTNNRRIITKNMWFNGTAISMKARRALENEKVTIVSHSSGYIHTLYDDATIDPACYNRFTEKLADFLSTPLTEKILGNFLRSRSDVHSCIQVRWNFHGKDYYIGLERLFDYELKHPYFFTESTRSNLMDNIDMEEFHTSPMPNRIILNDLEYYIEKNSIDLSRLEDLARLRNKFSQNCVNAYTLIKNRTDFCVTRPILPDPKKKKFSASKPIEVTPQMSWEEIINYIYSAREEHPTLSLAVYAFRDILNTEPEPFIKAAIERNPVSATALGNMDEKSTIEKIESLKKVSIYDEDYRAAQPDEVWNFGTGDGLEKALLAANVFNASCRYNTILITVEGNSAVLSLDGKKKYRFSTGKRTCRKVWKIL